MAVRPILITGEPVLHLAALPVTDFDDTLRDLVADLFDTMAEAPGVGLAAPQVGVGRRVFVYDWTDDADRHYRGVAVNPELFISPVPLGEPDIDEEAEGCLSIPGERFPLKRGERTILRALDLEGAPYEVIAAGWLARIFQHEYDHLNGILYVDRLAHELMKPVAKVLRKQGWGEPGHSWLPGQDDIEA